MICLSVYLLGSIVALYLASSLFERGEQETPDEYSQACVIYIAAIFLSWIFVIIYSYNKLSR